MQSFQSSPERPPAEPIAAPIVPEPVTQPAPSPEPDGHHADDSGSAVFVEAWDEHARRLTTEDATRRRRNSLRLAREVVETGILALVIFLGVRAVVQNYRVEGMSMEPTYHTGQYVIVNKGLYARVNLNELSRWVPFWEADENRYLFRGPRRGDVVVLESPSPIRRDRDIIKRVIGEPGDRIVIKDGRVFVNGHQLEEPYLHGAQTFCGGQWCDVTLGPDEYYVMGDNRANSIGSHMFGPVKADRIIGKSWLIYLPFSNFGPAPSGAPALVDAGSGQRP